MDQLVKSPSIQQPVMSQTKTMILQSTGNEFHYVSPPQAHQTQHQHQQAQQHLLAAVADAAAEAVDSTTHSTGNSAKESDGTSGAHFQTAATTTTINDETSNRAMMVLESATNYSVNLDTLPPPPPPPLTVPITNNLRSNSSLQLHEQAFSLIGRPTFSSIASAAAGSVLATNSATNVYGRLCYKEDVLYITEHSIEIGRNSSTSTVHFHVGKNSFVSRKHLQLLHDRSTSDFFLMCLSKNGVFVNDVFQRKSSEPLKLPKTCTFRFPSTNIRILFESYIDHPFEMPTKTNKTVENSNVIYAPLKISIPEHDKKSPFPSPTGTISAANSCPTSPRQNYQDYHHLGASATVYSSSSYNHTKNNNNHLNSSTGNLASSSTSGNHNFETDLFPPPSSSSFNDFEKPPYSYAQLIVQSISASPEKQLTLSGIYSFISKHYPYYRKEANKGWQNSIRHNLSLNRYFIKVARSQDEPGKGSFWRIDPNSESKLIDQSYKKRRQRGSQCFRTPYGMPRSAPVSPSHMDNSAENSPLHDIVLQSAPGSPGAYPILHSDHPNNEDSYGVQHRLIQNSSSYNLQRKNQFRLSYIDSGSPNAVIVSNVLSDQGISSSNVKTSYPTQQSHQTYDDQQIIVSSSAKQQSILQHQQIVTRLEAATDSDDNDDEYNHNITKRLKHDSDI